jgi:AcrR family transcriptional regulator
MKSKNNNDITTKETILLAAERVFAEKGFKGTTIREVAKEAGIVNSLIFYYFKNKAEMYEAVFQHAFDQLEDLIQGNLNLDLDRLGTVKALMFSVTEFAATHRNLMKILTREIIDNGSIVQKITEKYFNPLYDFASEFLAEGRKEALFRDVNPLQFLVSLMGMTVFYFVSDPLLQAVGLGEPYGSKAIQTRKLEVWNLVRSSLT